MRAIFLLLLGVYLYAMPAGYWAYSEPFEIQKDEFASWIVDEKIYMIRWSLYHNKQLVTHIKYDHYPYQTIFYDDYKLNSFKTPVKTTIETPPPTPYLYIVYEGFDDEAKSAKMHLYLFDPLGVVSIKKSE